MARFCGEVWSPWEIDTDASADSSDYNVEADGGSDCNFTDLNAADELLNHTDLKTRAMERKEACRCSEVVAIVSMEDVADFAFRRITDIVASDVSFNESLRRSFEVSKLQVK